MPIYEFKCPHCGKKFEELTSIEKRELVRCPDCGEKVQRVYQGACVHGGTNGQGGCSGHCEGCCGCHK